MPIYLDDLNKDMTAWFLFTAATEEDIEDIDPDDVNGDQFAVQIRHLSAGELDEINDVQFKTEFIGDADKGTFERKLNLNNLGATELLVMKAVSGWKGIYEDRKKKKSLPCTSGNKKRVLSRLVGFGEFVKRCHRLLVDRKAQETEELEKNSGSSAGGTPA